MSNEYSMRTACMQQQFHHRTLTTMNRVRSVGMEDFVKAVLPQQHSNGTCRQYSVVARAGMEQLAHCYVVLC